ncbi:formylglycine-generating enzyme family protein [Terriglobus albidus]|uniref:Formylglycine-generating enzyme family protein n=1 Tax=Terriglobus albidus TaxID=1592106 RepID=A0A5B9EEF8_9BACT|nr:SUMF1/EgtB/PvdO family nonheme iron enzyme [Terriglobus albidus]QEE28801.1 formylglycine-generating enzyme family protein [Terriglobus albidus]
MRISYREVWRTASLVVLSGMMIARANAQFGNPTGQLISPPPCLTMGAVTRPGTGCTPSTHRDWLAETRHWRTERLIRIGYDGSRYKLPELQWAQHSFIQPQMMVHDRYLYDPASGKYTVDRYLDDLQKRYGGIDAVLVWAVYPNVGVDDRNQHDITRTMPGGVTGLKQMVADFHRRGVKVLFPMMMWDQGTQDPGTDWPTAFAQFLKEIDADGVNGDTQDGVPLAFSLAAEKAGHPLAFEPEGGPSDEALAWNVLTWGQYQYTPVPGVDKYRWLEPRHQVNIQGRWDRDKTNALQYAFFNGEGWESWENVWGIWNGITPRDGEATRRVATIERAVAPFFASDGWEPLYPMLRYGVYASRWPQADETVWTIVNRSEYDVDGNQMTAPYKQGMRFFDLYHGTELKPEIKGDEATLSFSTEAHGFGAILATAGEPGPKFRDLMGKMKEMTAKPLSSYSHEWQALPQHAVEIAASPLAASAPENMVRIDGGAYLFRVQGIEIEGANDIGVDVQFPWEDSARRFHENPMQIKPFYMDKFPVTNADFKKFLDAAQYRPKDPLNFLKDWKNGTYPEGWANKPVTWVSLEDAREYAKWAGKRLPHEWEWQYSAQGGDGRTYPWGNCDWLASQGGGRGCPADAANLAPTPDKGRIILPPSDVDAHPQGASPFGVMDMVGNVWQWTDEYVDEHTRAAILRGGSHYQPQGSIWYFPQAYKNDQHGKLLLMAPSYDRSAAVGFRCVKDAQ